MAFFKLHYIFLAAFSFQLTPACSRWNLNPGESNETEKKKKNHEIKASGQCWETFSVKQVRFALKLVNVFRRGIGHDYSSNRAGENGEQIWDQWESSLSNKKVRAMTREETMAIAEWFWYVSKAINMACYLESWHWWHASNSYLGIDSHDYREVGHVLHLTGSPFRASTILKMSNFLYGVNIITSLITG